MTHARLALGALAAVALATAGCGSSSDDSAKAPAPKATATTATTATTGTTDSGAKIDPALSKSEYVRRADALCSDANRIGARANVAVRKAVAQRRGDAASAAIERYLPAYEAKVKQLKTLPQPDEDQRILHAFMKVVDGQVTTLKAESRALRDNDAKMMKKITDAQAQALEFADTLAQGYGFQVCGRAG